MEKSTSVYGSKPVDGEEQDGEYEPRSLLGDGGPTLSVRVPIVVNTDEYEVFPDEYFVTTVLRERQRDGELYYTCKFDDGHVAEIPFDTLIGMENGPEAFSLFTPHDHGLRSSRGPTDHRDNLFVDELSSDDVDTSDLRLQTSTRRLKRKLDQIPSNSPGGSEEDSTTAKRVRKPNGLLSGSAGSREGSTHASSEHGSARTRALRSSGTKQYRMLSYKVKQPDEETDAESAGSSDVVFSDLLPPAQKRPLRHSRRGGRSGQAQSISSDDDYNRPARRSGRTERKKNIYKEPNPEDDFIPKYEPLKSKPKPVLSKERFPIYDNDDDFVQFHNQTCDTCHRTGDNKEVGPLVYCQGCSYSYHRVCLGGRSVREHLVTRIAEGSHVLQCKRCIGRVKDRTAPSFNRCTQCRNPGPACAAFRPLTKGKLPAAPKASPEVDISPDLINNAENILFRCVNCRRAYHFDHLSPRVRDTQQYGSFSKRRLEEYSGDWRCLDCITIVDKIQALVAWRPVDQSSFNRELRIDDFNDDEREYLVKFEGLSYFRAKWLPGSWVWGVINTHMRNKFFAGQPPPILTSEDAIDPEYLNVETVLDCKFTSYVPLGEDAQVDLLRIKEVSKALVKYRGLTFDDVVWEELPPKASGERWQAFEDAYNDYIHGFYVHLPKGVLKKAEKARSQNFDSLEKKHQPKYIIGGTLMDYQKDGMNWLYYKWWKQENAILADEMGLGKTIQIISFLSILQQEHKIWPFLIVVPNSTVPNWKREIRLWNPGMRVVAYSGLKEAKRLIRLYDLFHPGGKDLKCHIVITSYTTAADDANVLKQIPWECLIVDEGQRLKNDGTLLYKVLSGFKIKHKVLLTGTPLQNNPRELFNLLQFLDPQEMKADHLEEEYGTLTKENVPKLHALIRPYFLRRTKVQVLKMLPPMAEIIVPVSMTKVTRKLYKSIFLRDTGLLKSILGRAGSGKNTERAKLSNILMQLRKCLCHPFLYSDDVEEKVDDPEISHKNLVEASAKLGFLNLILPKLKEGGHRVLLFSQFLGMLDIVEDFLDGIGLKHTRLDGAVSTQERQKRIDAYNAPKSELFAFLLSTRAGGVGINLASADTVIILDPDFNPHQDLQALSRAHRIGQQKKVLVFHLMTRDTAEEKIMQLGKKKLSLDHLIIDRMGADEDEVVDVESILKFGTGALFDDNDEDAEEKVIKYDAASIDALLDRSKVEQTTATDKENSAESVFSFARVWENDKGALVENGFRERDEEISESTWDKILREREAEVRREQEKARREQLGRGKRARAPVHSYLADLDIADSGSDTDFQASDPQSDTDSEDDAAFNAALEAMSQEMKIGVTKVKDSFVKRPIIEVPAFEVHSQTLPHPRRSPSLIPDPPPPLVLQPQKSPQQPQQQLVAQNILPKPAYTKSPTAGPKRLCLACRASHVPGQCPYKLAGVELCPLCKIAHYGKGPTCPHLSSETRVVALMACLRESSEDPKLVNEAMRYLRGRLGELRRRKKLARHLEERQKALEAAAKGPGLPSAPSNQQVQRNGLPVAASASNTSVMVIE